jgi:cysteine sulfinate desulfinase/cysteine desulfurase-like protein
MGPVEHEPRADDPEPGAAGAVRTAVERARGSLRLSLGRETRPEDIDVVMRALVEAVARLREISSVT